ncbi:MAG: hypothetical protein SGPRY_000334 [Prymnesium sp.]
MPTQSHLAAAYALVNRLGGPRLRLVAVGGAVVPPPLLRFLRECFGKGGAGGGEAIVSDGYGMAEVPGGIARDGVPLPGVEVKLKRRVGEVDVGDLGRGEEEAVGEILVKTRRGEIVGSLDGDGWFHTGDLGRWEEEGGVRRLRVVDRVGFAVKLSHGEYFAPQHAEAVYSQQCPSISGCVLFARAGDKAATAIVTWEVPCRVVIDRRGWDERSGCASTHGKLRRQMIARRNGLLPPTSQAAVGVREAESELEDGERGGIDWWSGLGGDSVEAIALVGAWGRRGGGNAITVRDVYSLTLRELRCKASGHAEKGNHGDRGGANVKAVDALLRILSEGREPTTSSPAPRFVFVSTMSVLPRAHAVVAAPSGWEEWGQGGEGLIPPSWAAWLDSGYAQSKLVAEHCLSSAAAAGKIRLCIARLGLLGSAKEETGMGLDTLNSRRDWLSLVLTAIHATGASPAGLTSGQRAVGLLPVDVAAEALAFEAGVGGEGRVGVRHLDAAACGIAPRSLSALLDEIEEARGPDASPLKREVPYPKWRSLVASLGPPASLALAVLPAAGRGGTLRLPSGARRRLRELAHLTGLQLDQVPPMDQYCT